MAFKLSKKVVEAINDVESLKSIATVDKNGVPHVVYKGSLHLDNDGNLVFYDIIESSQINKNLVYAIWFNRKVAINILSKDRKSYLIIGTPKQSVTSGRAFEEVYKKLQEKRPDGDLNAIWTIIPESEKEETFSVRVEESAREFPILGHLDRFAK